MRLERSGGFYDEIFASLRRHRVRIASTIETPDIETCISLIACGMGVGIVSSIMRALQIEGVTYRPLEPNATVETLAIAWRRERSSTSAVRAFVDHVRDAQLTFGAHPHQEAG
jgi:DNA-binding transcriptional LysR family regulator